MNTHPPYPTFDESAWPKLPAAQYRHSLATWQVESPGLGRGTRLRIPVSAWNAAGINLAAVEPRVAVIGGRVLLVTSGSLWEALGPDARIARDGIRRSVSVCRAPRVNLENGHAIIGAGYLVLVAQGDLAEFENVPVLERHEALLTESSIAKVDAELPRVHAQGFRTYSVIKLAHKQSRFVDLVGRIWEAAGMNIGDLILVTRFADGVRITKATGYENDGALVGKRADEDRAYPTKRFGEAVLGAIQLDTVRVAFTEDALYIFGDKIKLSEFGLTNKSKVTGSLRVEDGEFQPKPKGRRTNFSVYPVRREEPRIQVQGDWLERYGFVPGVRFALEDHPLIRGRLVARIDPKGEHKVTQHRPGQPGGKLYIPTKLLEHFNSDDVKVFGTVEGLHVQQHFASSWKTPS